MPTGAAGPADRADVITSTADGSVRLATSSIDPSVTVPSNPGDPVVDVHLDEARQRLYGVGAALTESSAHLLIGLSPTVRHQVLEALFAPDQGGLSVVRLVIGASDFSLAHVSLDDSSTPDPDLTHFSIARDRAAVIPVLKEILAINPSIELVASPWSAPGWMKDSGNYLTGRLLPQYEGAYARYLVKYLEAYRAEGIDIQRLTVQNEPLSIQVTYPSMIMEAPQQIRFLEQSLRPELAHSDLDTRVLVYDHNWCNVELPGGCVGSGPPQYPLSVLAALPGTYPVAGTALHCYGGDQIQANEAVHAAAPDLELWQTECSGGTWQGSRTDAFTSTVHLLLNDWNHWANASILWNLALDPAGGPHLGGCNGCRGVVTVDSTAGTWTPEIERDVLATMSRFGPRGSGVLATTVTSSTGVEATAVCSPDRRAAAIVWNPGAATTASVRFGSLDVSVPLAAGSFVAVRAPASVDCSLAPMPEPSAKPAPPATTPTPGGTAPTAPPAVAVSARPTFTG